MRVAIYSGTFKKEQDGAVKALYQLTESLLKEKISVGVWAPSITPQKRRGLFLFKTPSFPFPLYKDYKVSFPTGEIKKQLLWFKPNIILVTVPDIVGSCLLKFASNRGIPAVISYHTNFPSYLKYYHLNFLSNPAWRFIVWYCNKADSVYVPTQEVARILQNIGVKNVKIWSRGVNRDSFNPSHRSVVLRRLWKALGKKVLLYSGRFVWYKDLDIYLKVYELYKKYGPENVVFVLAGDGPIKKELESCMPDAHFPGYLYGKDLSQVYASSDLFLFPSTTETLGNVVQEALSSGLPAVVSDIGGCQEIIQSSGGGLIAQAGNAQMFYECCKRLVEDEDLYEEKKRKGLRYAADQNWDDINRTIIEEYKKMAGVKRDKPKFSYKYRLGAK